MKRALCFSLLLLLTACQKNTGSPQNSKAAANSNDISSSGIDLKNLEDKEAALGPLGMQFADTSTLYRRSYVLTNQSFSSGEKFQVESQKKIDALGDYVSMAKLFVQKYSRDSQLQADTKESSYKISAALQLLQELQNNIQFPAYFSYEHQTDQITLSALETAISIREVTTQDKIKALNRYLSAATQYFQKYCRGPINLIDDKTSIASLDYSDFMQRDELQKKIHSAHDLLSELQ